MEEQSEGLIKQKSKIDTGIWIGLVAIVINVITVSVYMYQAQIMQSQQHASAWPYLEWLTSYNEEQCYIEIANNGIGPAIITTVAVKVNGKQMDNMDSLFTNLIGTTRFPHLTSTVQNRVLPAGKTIRIFQVNNEIWAGKVFMALQASHFELEICYESIYGESWTCSGTNVVKGKCR
jgi:hypothetical protein